MYQTSRVGFGGLDETTLNSEPVASVAEAAPGPGPTYQLDAESAGAIAHRAMTTGNLAVVDTALAALYYSNSSQAAMMASFTDTVVQYDKAISGDGMYVLIDATAKNGDGAALLAELQAMGLANGASFRGAASGWLPIAKIGDLSATTNIAMARQSVMVSDVGSVTTQADVAMGADIARNTYGVTGAGVKIGVMSDSFNVANVTINGLRDTFQLNVDSGDLLPTTKVLEDIASGTDEGRAMAQLVQDLAPGADITFATAFTGQAGFANNIVRLAQAGNKVIVDDVRYYTELMFQNGPIAQAVNQVATEFDVAYFSSAGNQSAQGWQGAWSNPAGATYVRNGVTYQLMNFGNVTTTGGTLSQDYLTLTGASGLLALGWDQPSAIAGGAGSAVNVDLFVSSDIAGATVTHQSISNNIGNDAVEFVNLGATGATRYIRVGVPVGQTVPGQIRLVLSTGTVQNTSTNTNPGSGFGHSVAENGVGVGAAPYYATPLLTDPTRINTTTIPVPAHENFSSRGTATLIFDDNGVRRANPIIRSAAQITAADGGNTTFFSSDDADADNIPNFYGTSAAAPDAAAVAVLMRQVDPTLSYTDILAVMQAVAIDMDDRFTTGYDVGFDTRTGAGFVQADRVLRALIDRVIDNPSQPTITGTSRGETIIAGSAANVVNAGGGNDIVYGNLGNDTLNGDAGNDVLYGNQDNDTLQGGAGNDTLFGGQGDDILYGGTGDDFLEGNLGDDSLNGSAGFNTATYKLASGSVTVTLADPAGIVTGVGTSSGAAGSDKLVSIQGIIGSDFNDTLTGDSANNTLSGENGDDTINAGAGDDVVEGGLGADTLNGGAGNDTVSYATATSGVTVDLNSAAAQNTGVTGSDTLSGFESVIGSAFADTLTTRADGSAFGGDGDDRLAGPSALPTTVNQPDVVKPASTANTSRAAAIDLTGSYDQVFNPNITDSRTVPHATVQATVGSTPALEYYRVTLAAGARLVVDIDSYNSTTDSVLQLQDAAGNVLLTNDDNAAVTDPGDTTSNNSFFDVTVTTAGDYFIVVGGYGSQTNLLVNNPAGATYLMHVSATGQTVTLDGGLQSGGNAFLYGEGGNDTLLSGLGDDLLNGGAGLDTVSYAAAATGVTVSLATQGAAQATGAAGSDTLISIENVTGTNFADTLTGSDAANVLSGGGGIDTINGGAGADVLYGNQDNDVLYGNQDNDVIYGGQGDDVIYGGQGSDVIFGNAGADVLYGNVGNDVFKYGSASDSTSTVTDTIFQFERFIDKVDLRDVIRGGVYSSNITYATVGGVTTASVNLDLGADGSVDMVIKVLGTGTQPITAADILFS